MRTLLFAVAIIAIGLKWNADACPGPKPTPTTSTPEPTTALPPENLTCLNGSDYKAIIFLVDGSWSMGDGIYTFLNGTTANVSRKGGPWDVSYNQWTHILPLIVSFQDVITNQFVVVMKQYSSTNYLNECCRNCTGRNFTNVLKGKWTAEQWNASAELVYGMHQNCDTQTYGYLTETINTWEEKKRELNMNATARSLIILITDGLPNNQTAKNGDGPNSENTKALLDRSSADLFLVYPANLTFGAKSKEKEMYEALLKIVKDEEKDAFPFNFATGRVNDTLRNDIVAQICRNQQAGNG